MLQRQLSHFVLSSVRLRARVRVRVTLRLAVYRQSVRLGDEPPETHSQISFSQMNTCGHSPYIASSLTRGWACHLQLLLGLASVFILGFGSSGTRDHISLSQIRDFPFCRPLRFAGLRWKYATPPPHGNYTVFSSRSYVTSDGQSASLSCCQEPIWGLRPDF
jgi:hypothetical protein